MGLDIPVTTLRLHFLRVTRKGMNLLKCSCRARGITRPLLNKGTLGNRMGCFMIGPDEPHLSSVLVPNIPRRPVCPGALEGIQVQTITSRRVWLLLIPRFSNTKQPVFYLCHTYSLLSTYLIILRCILKYGMRDAKPPF